MADDTTAKPSPAGGTIDIETAARLAKCTPRHIQQLVKTGFIPRAEHGKYTILGVVHGRIESLQAEQKTTTKSAAAARVQDVRAEEIQLRLDEKRGAMLQQGQAEAVNVIDVYFGGLKSDLLAIPARVTSDLLVRRKIEDGIDEAFGAAASRARAAASRVKPDGPALRTARKAKPRRVGAAKPNVSA